MRRKATTKAILTLSIITTLVAHTLIPVASATPMAVSSPFFGALTAGPDGACEYGVILDISNPHSSWTGEATLIYFENPESGKSTSIIEATQITGGTPGCLPQVLLEVTVDGSAWGKRVVETEVSEDGCVTTTRTVDLNSNQHQFGADYFLEEFVMDQCSGDFSYSMAYVNSIVGF